MTKFRLFFDTLAIMLLGMLLPAHAGDKPKKEPVPIYKCVKEDHDVYTDLVTQLIGCKEVVVISKPVTPKKP